jgi:hypothetical protein
MRKYLYGLMTLSLIMAFSQSATAKIDKSKIWGAVRSNVTNITYLDKDGKPLGTQVVHGGAALNIPKDVDPKKALAMVKKTMASGKHADHHKVTDPETGDEATLFSLGKIINQGVNLATNVIGTIAPIAVPLATAAIPALIAAGG